MKEYQINNFKEKLYYEKLENGLEVFLLPMKNKQNFSCMYAVKYGGRDINFKINGNSITTPTGIAHFLEHKMFERENDPFKFFQKFGTDVNASTSNDYTGYYFVGNKSFEKSLKYILNWLQKLEITEEQVKKEQGIILEEASMYKDSPDRVLYNKIKENIFINDPSKNKVIGTDEDIVSITKEELELCFNNFYTPDNMYLIATGSINPEKAITIIKEETSNLTKNINKIEKVYLEEPNDVAKEYEEIKMNVEIPKVAVAYKIPKDNFKHIKITSFELDIYLHSLLSIGLGTTSKIREKWLEENLFSSSMYRIFEIESHYIIELYANTNKADELIESLTEYIKDIKIDEESFEREKKLWIANEIRTIDSPVNSLYEVLDDLLDYNKVIPNKINIIKKLNYSILEEVKKSLSFDTKAIVKVIPNN
ncbi:MAG: EF-P 5-aminopentanol modification-associated protein YfmH [Bacilli bacterium]